MSTPTFTIWDKPESGPLIVQERDETGSKWVWLDRRDAEARAMALKRSFPHMDFVVRKEDDNGCASVVLDTSAQSPEATP